MVETLDSSIALVTGSSRGIGAATARELALRGAKVVINYRTSEDEAAEVVADIEATGGDAMTVQADVTETDAVEEMVAEIEGEWDSVDLLISNANIPFATKPLRELTWNEFSDKLDAELKAAFTCSKAVLPEMVASDGGQLIYISSGLSQSPQRGFAAYGTAKAGLNAFAKYVAEEYGEHGVRANVISPGLVETDATADQLNEDVRKGISRTTPLSRVAQPDDIAKTVAAIAGEGAQFLTGTYTPVNGGISME
ncbi:SDR family NAD(P)-dependent oxidoreductase [Haladaptatus caseinilyticus]|uniref:SDR family NAD(P)-dependent oxidoreductase n=1 Tax=Haladaptatus caseinilyticus TaxID=2993314 RepID=UPI00224B89AD|nr:SDR family oxidoreductase [Haladaptatus caseinilyticus]